MQSHQQVWRSNAHLLSECVWYVNGQFILVEIISFLKLSLFFSFLNQSTYCKKPMSCKFFIETYQNFDTDILICWHCFKVCLVKEELTMQRLDILPSELSDSSAGLSGNPPKFQTPLHDIQVITIFLNFSHLEGLQFDRWAMFWEKYSFKEEYYFFIMPFIKSLCCTKHMS